MAHIEVKTENPTPSPQWLKNAVIYELNPKTFTSPDGEGSGSGSGTFRSTKEKLEYLKELGVNTIWLAGVTQGSEFFSGFDTWCDFRESISTKASGLVSRKRMGDGRF